MALVSGLRKNIREIFLKIKSNSSMIVCKNLVKSYDGRLVIDDVSFTVAPGEITVITGPSGAGKSTLLKIASLIENPTSGTVVIDNKEYSFNGKEIQKVREQFPKIGVVFQNLFLWPHLTNRDNILLSVKKNLNEETKNDFKELVDLFSIRDIVENYPNQCSLGQRQRVAFVRSFMLNPSYLFLDEITSSLDVEQIGFLLNYLWSLKNKGKAILLITHFLKFAHLAANQILFMEKGKIIEQGGKEILITPKTDRLKKFLNTLEYIVPK